MTLDSMRAADLQGGEGGAQGGGEAGGQGAGGSQADD